MDCKKCNTVVTGRFCTNCGTDCSVLKCQNSNCSKQIDPSKNFCGYCGTQIAPLTSKSAQSTMVFNSQRMQAAHLSIPNLNELVLRQREEHAQQSRQYAMQIGSSSVILMPMSGLYGMHF